MATRRKKKRRSVTRSKKVMRAKKNPMRKRKGHNVWVTREGRVAKHPYSVKTGSKLLRARKKAKKAHKRMPRRIGRVGVASGTIALHLGAHGDAKKKAATKSRPKKTAKRTATSRRVLKVDTSRRTPPPHRTESNDVIDYLDDLR